MKEHKIFNSKFCERGGGIRVILFDNILHNSSITLDNNTLEGNSAVFGGGTLICVSGSTSHNRISILNSHFINNNVLAGGGGVDMGYTKSTLSKSMQPSIPPIGRRWTFSTSQVYIA